MGYYINPRDISKEDWLVINGELTAGPCEITETHMPVCLVNNGPFNAAAVGYSKNEVDAFNQPTDHRSKLWFKVPIAALKEVGAI